MMAAPNCYPQSDIRSMFRGPNGSIKTPAIVRNPELKSKELKEEKKPATKKPEKKDEIDYLCDAYCKT